MFTETGVCFVYFGTITFLFCFCVNNGHLNTYLVDVVNKRKFLCKCGKKMASTNAMTTVSTMWVFLLFAYHLIGWIKKWVVKTKSIYYYNLSVRSEFLSTHA